jgi:predicted transcriptional regulator
MNHARTLPNKLQERVNPWEGVALRDVMTAPVVSLKTTTVVGDAIQFLLQFGVNEAPVVDPHGKLVGVLSENELVNVLANPDAWSMPIDGIMRCQVVCYQEDTPLESICEFLSCAAVRQAFIVRDGCPIGVVTRRSLLRCCNNRRGSRAIANLAATLHLSGEVNRAQLMQGVRVVAQCAAQLPNALSDEADDSILALVADVGKLQRLIDEMLTCSRDSHLPGFIGDVSDASALGSMSGPMAPLG